MFGIFKSEPPRYKGQGQPNGYSAGVIGSLARVVAGEKPAYRGASQPAAQQGLFGLFSASPSYRTASPTAQPVTGVGTAEPVPAPDPEPEPEVMSEPELELDAECVSAESGNGEGVIELEHGEPLLARVPVTIVIRRSEA